MLIMLIRDVYNESIIDELSTEKLVKLIMNRPIRSINGQ